MSLLYSILVLISVQMVGFHHLRLLHEELLLLVSRIRLGALHHSLGGVVNYLPSF